MYIYMYIMYIYIYIYIYTYILSLTPLQSKRIQKRVHILYYICTHRHVSSIRIHTYIICMCIYTHTYYFCAYTYTYTPPHTYYLCVHTIHTPISQNFSRHLLRSRFLLYSITEWHPFRAILHKSELGSRTAHPLKKMRRGGRQRDCN